jgi:hypothetical protein
MSLVGAKSGSRVRIAAHQRLITAAIEGGDVRGVLDSCHLPECSHRHQMKEMLLEAISVLEDTRKAFKSSQLETLRKKMIRVLAEKS